MFAVTRESRGPGEPPTAPDSIADEAFVADVHSYHVFSQRFECCEHVVALRARVLIGRVGGRAMCLGVASKGVFSGGKMLGMCIK